MINLLTDRIEAIEREVHALKDTYLKTATSIKTLKEDAGLFSFPLALGYGEAYCPELLVLTVETTDNSSQLCSLYLEPEESASGYDMASRTVNVWQKTSVGDHTVFHIAVGSLNAEDIATLSGGGSVTLKYRFSVVGTSKFSITSSREMM